MNNDENYAESRKDGTIEEIVGVTVEDNIGGLRTLHHLNLLLGNKNKTNLLKNTLKKALLLEILAKI